MNDHITAEQIRTLLSAHLKGISRAEVSSMGLEVFPRLMEVLAHQSHCADCQSHTTTLYTWAQDIRPIFRGNSSDRKNFENHITQAMYHLKQQHGISPRGRIKTYVLLGGSIVGILAGLWLSPILFPEAQPFESALLGWFVCILPAWVMGTFRENRLQKKHLLY